MKAFPQPCKASLVLLSIILSSVSCLAQAPSTSKTDKAKKSGAPSDNSSGASAGSAFWVTPRDKVCDAVNGKAIIFFLNTAASSKTQPYFVTLVQQDGVPTFYAGEALSIEVIANETQVKEIPMINFGVDLQKADPLNVAPVRPSSSPTTSPATDTIPKYFCLTWPQKLIGDTIPKITLTAIYKPPKPEVPKTEFPKTEASKPDAAATDVTDSETNITLGVVSFPQVHTLYHYNIATGVVVGSVRNPSYSRVQSTLPSNGTPAQYETVKDNGNVFVAPALFFTAYLFGLMDAESAWKPDWTNLKPQPSVGFSLSSPADDFFFGFASEIQRNVQFVYGYQLAKINKLSPTIVNDPTSSAAPATVQRFNGGVYGGLTFNIDFIKGLFTGK